MYTSCYHAEEMVDVLLIDFHFQCLPQAVSAMMEGVETLVFPTRCIIVTPLSNRNHVACAMIEKSKPSSAVWLSVQIETLRIADGIRQSGISFRYNIVIGLDIREHRA